MHIGVWRSLVARLNGVQEAASSNLVTPTIAEPPILGQEKKEDVQARLPLFSFSLSRAALPLLSVTRLFEIVTRSCLDISISRHPLSAIAIPSLLFAPLLSNLVTPTIAEPPILGQEKESASWRALSSLMIALLLLFRQVDFCNISLFSVPKFKIVISIDIRARNLKDKHYLFFKSRA